MEPIGLYVHVPLCLSKCPYCDFYSLPYTKDRADQYVQAILRSIVCIQEENRPAVNTIYFGGGTPILLGEHLLDILEALKVVFAVSPDCEITVEANPAAMTLDTLITLRKGGFNRISLGVQSATDKQLHSLGRLHNLAQASESVDFAILAGFSNISVDLMLATPDQTLQDIDKFVELFCNRVSHISGYLLTIEENTPFAKQHIENCCPDEELTAQIYLHTIETLNNCGFLQYEVSNFSKPGFESRHNLKYWNCKEYLGFGPSAHSFRDGVRKFFPRDIESFISAANPWDLFQTECMGGTAFEYAMLRLRLTEGLEFETLLKRFPEYNISKLVCQAKKLEPHGLLTLSKNKIVLTKKGFLLSNSVISHLL